MKKKITILSFILAVLLGGIFLFSRRSQNANAMSGNQSLINYTFNSTVAHPLQSFPSSTYATTTLAYPTTTSTTTSPWFDMSDATVADMDLEFIASSSATQYTICNEFSHNQIDAFAETNHTDVSNTQTTLAGKCYFITPGTTATTSLNMQVTSLATQYMRFNVHTLGANGAVWVLLNKKVINR